MIRKKIKLLIVDDSKMFRDMLSMALKNNPNMEVIGTAEDAFDAKDKVGELHPDVIIIDFEMPKMDGVTFIKQLMQQYPIPCILVTSADISEKEVLEAGAAGFKQQLSAALLRQRILLRTPERPCRPLMRRGR